MFYKVDVKKRRPCDTRGNWKKMREEAKLPVIRQVSARDGTARWPWVTLTYEMGELLSESILRVLTQRRNFLFPF